MMHHEFQIGTRFRCGQKLWLCTDVGTRVIVAVCLQPFCRSNDWGRGLPEEAQDAGWAREPSGIDASWLEGPPYAIAEIIFDENDFAGCEPA